MPKPAAAAANGPVLAVAHAIKPYEPPRVEVGQVVLWTYGPGDRPAAALVVKVGTGSLTLAVHADGVKDHILKNGVRHVDDPFLKTHPASDQGVWDLTPRDRKLNDMIEAHARSVADESGLDGEE